MKREREYAVAAIVVELCGCDLIFLFCCIDCDEIARSKGGNERPPSLDFIFDATTIYGSK